MQVLTQGTDEVPSHIPGEAEVLTPGVGLALVRLLWEKRRLLVLFTVAGILLSLLIAFLIPKRYESTARLMPPDTRSRAGLLSSLSNNVAGNMIAADLLGTRTSGALFISILKSRTVQDRLVQRYDLRKVYRTQYQDRARQELADNTNIAEDVKSGVITISVRDRDPVRGAAIVNSYIEELDRLNRDLSTSAAHRQRVFLEERLKSVKQDLDLAASKFGSFASATGTLDFQEQGKAMLEAAGRLQAELISAQSELRSLQQIYADENIRVRAVKARIAELQRQLDKNSGSGTSLSGMIRDLPKLGPAYADLVRNAKIQEALYEALTKEYEMAKLEEVKEIPSVKVLDPGIVPERKASPSRTLVLVAGTLVSFVFGALWIWSIAILGAVEPGNPWRMFYEEVRATSVGYLQGANIPFVRKGTTDSEDSSDKSARDASA